MPLDGFHHVVCAITPIAGDILRTAAKLAAAGALAAHPPAIARATEPAGLGAGTFRPIHALLHTATTEGDLPGVVALAATDGGVAYEGVFGSRRLGEGPAMTRDSVFRIASMVKLITSIAALRLVEQDKLSLDAPAPDIDPALGAPQVLDGFDVAGKPRLRPARRPILLRHLLTHTAGFTYRLWDAKALRYFTTIEKLPAPARSNCRVRR